MRSLLQIRNKREYSGSQKCIDYNGHERTEGNSKAFTTTREGLDIPCGARKGSAGSPPLRASDRFALRSTPVGMTLFG